jgi:membrane protein YqaA with SNARE-associated domain
VPEASAPASSTRPPWWRTWLTPILAGVAFIVLNILAYLWLTSPAGRQILGSLREYALPGAFLVMLIANATVIVPVPWPAIFIPIAEQSGNPLAAIVVGAFGSVIGETVAFVVGRSGRGVVEQTRFYTWVRQQLEHPWRAFAVLFALSAPPNPLFDVAGITAGAMGLPYWLFFSAVFLARIIRIWLILVLAGLLGL